MIANIDPSAPTQAEIEESQVNGLKFKLASAIAVEAAKAAAWDLKATRGENESLAEGLTTFAISVAEQVVERFRPRSTNSRLVN